MRKLTWLTISICSFTLLHAQKKPLDHTVYDGWQSIGEKLISNNGQWIVYTVNPQEGDNELVIQASGNSYKKIIPRGYNASITEDSRFVVFKIRPLFRDSREARIKKRKAEEMPKDSLAIVELGRDSIWKLPRVKGYRLPEKSPGWVAYQLEKLPEAGARGKTADMKKLDSLTRIIDSLRVMINRREEGMPGRRQNRDDEEADLYTDAGEEEVVTPPAEAASDLVLRNLQTGEEKRTRYVTGYLFSKNGRKLLAGTARDPGDSLSEAMILLYDLWGSFTDTLSRGGNEFRNLALSGDGEQVAFLAERDARPKELQKFFKLWYFREGMDTAVVLVDKHTPGMKIGTTVSENGALSFSRSGRRLFFGTAPVRPPKDTTLVDMDLVKVDIWHYNDDYLQPVQLNRLRRDQQENFLAVYLLDQGRLQQLASKEIPQVIQTSEGDGDQFVGLTDAGRRIESQWTGATRKDIYLISVNDGTRKLIKSDLSGVIMPYYVSPGGKYVMWYDSKARNYFVWDGAAARNITEKIKVPLFDEEYDSPSDPPPYGLMGWQEGDSAVYVYDRYDVWNVPVIGKRSPALFRAANSGKRGPVSLRYIRLDSAERFINPGQELLFRAFDERNKQSALYFTSASGLPALQLSPYSYGAVQKARDAKRYIYTRENYVSSPDLVLLNRISTLPGAGQELKLSAINRQQAEYNWGTAELFSWKAYNGRESQGIVYKPEDFDPAKKYPMICYFYETLSDGLYGYQAPAPTPSRLNIPFFVSRGYIVFAPDIHYSTGHPGRDAYNYIVSGARALVKKGFVDSTRIGLQGQSWGGYQVAYLVTATSLFKAAWAGAPVANMTSAYGGIRWESGMNRQFQYEKTQSRIGATLWEKPQLYIENSPLFHLPKVKTPLVIMANDADGAVPWYQGIELFTGLRRLGKKVWMLNYNGEAHNLVERKNRKDIQVREQQFFDWLLKEAQPARWITEGVPAVDKGKDWGLEEIVN
ncbi:MAG: prolyl oligopeptidase family serine peptidase [Chitinophagaceae bacterium]